eukprot:jgi/Psemu1/43086/gm1.43086_g
MESTTNPNDDETYEVGKLTFSVNPATKPEVNKPIQIDILYKKEFRPKIGSKEEAELIKVITRKQGEPFKKIYTSIKNPDSLRSNLSLRQRLNHTQAIWNSANLLNPCSILFPTANTARLKTNANGKITQVYLFTNHWHVTSDQVAESCKYYAQHVNLVPPRKAEGTFAQQGGPLFLTLLLDHLLISNDASEAALVKIVKNYKIQQNWKEDIPEVTKLISSITATVMTIRDHKAHQLPDDYFRNLTKGYGLGAKE